MSSFTATPETTRPLRQMPWVEKYRPERVEDVAHQDEVVQTLKSAIEQGSVPHLLFYGPPGTGEFVVPTGICLLVADFVHYLR